MGKVINKFQLVSRIYSSQKKNSERKGLSAPDYSQNDLMFWLFKQEKFRILFESWEDSGFDKQAVPSVDRKYDYIGYTLLNLQLMTWKENKDKGNRDRYNGSNTKQSQSVVQYDVSGELIEHHHSINSATRKTDTKQSYIRSCCKGDTITANGYVWEYDAFDARNPIKHNCDILRYGKKEN